MRKQLHDYLNLGYYGNLYSKIGTSLDNGEDVFLFSLSGCGDKVALNFLLKMLRKNKKYDRVYYLDMEVEEMDLVKYIREKISVDSQRKLMVIRNFHNVDNKEDVLEKLCSYKTPHPKALAYLIAADHTGILRPDDYFGRTRSFTSQRYKLLPFDFQETCRMMEVYEKAYGWRIKPTRYRRIFELSGGIPGFFKHICQEHVEEGVAMEDLAEYQKNPSILFGLKNYTRMLISLTKPDLKELGLTDDRGKIRSRLLADYFRIYQSSLISELYPGLSRLEAKVLTYLWENRGKPVSLDKIGDLMEMGEERYSLWAIYKLVSRLKPKVVNHFTVKNAKGRGYILISRGWVGGQELFC